MFTLEWRIIWFQRATLVFFSNNSMQKRRRGGGQAKFDPLKRICSSSLVKLAFKWNILKISIFSLFIQKVFNAIFFSHTHFVSFGIIALISIFKLKRNKFMWILPLFLFNPAVTWTWRKNEMKYTMLSVNCNL